ncbi:MAG: flagellar motor switch protein FliN [Hyphomicrobiales bacterium]|nr:flagellar motor switch protein FliN [Hyphomicrobiales bacterium]
MTRELNAMLQSEFETAKVPYEETDGTLNARDSAENLSSNLEQLMKIPIDVRVVVGSTKMSISDFTRMEQGAFIQLDRELGDPVDIFVGDCLIAKGELMFLDDDKTRFGVRLTEIIENKQLTGDAS